MSKGYGIELVMENRQAVFVSSDKYPWGEADVKRGFSMVCNENQSLFSVVLR
jgi:hypothetical protein